MGRVLGNVYPFEKVQLGLGKNTFMKERLPGKGYQTREGSITTGKSFSGQDLFSLLVMDK